MLISQHNEPPWHPLYCSVKVNRARQHLRELQERIEAFGKLYPYDVETGDEPEWQGVDPGRFPIVTFQHGLPEIIAGCLGDCLQAYKSALDHALYHLTVLYYGTNHPSLGRIEFPIYVDPVEYARKRKKLIGHLPVEIRAFIDELQPHLGRANADRQALFTLHELARVDRHRHIHVMTGAILGPATISVSPIATEPETPAHAPEPFAIHVRATARYASGVQVNVTTTLSIVINESPIGIFPLNEGLADIDLVVRAILAALASGDYWR